MRLLDFFEIKKINGLFSKFEEYELNESHYIFCPLQILTLSFINYIPHLYKALPFVILRQNKFEILSFQLVCFTGELVQRKNSKLILIKQDLLAKFTFYYPFISPQVWHIINVLVNFTVNAKIGRHKLIHYVIH